ncbi:hypothetical protein QYE76_070191 [Lolium multiflorum]|uniref:Bifunctional inhibitor/plant lipid transfer protein/seed storage helical domain-containing protein n=1 Tax=Lolium multiflorum TaxID=4521 RepID=A0AAD8SHR8_LOLMU|nr:hypothetical protein QYE76_070191 [Lolium multiflorum]
MAATSTTGTAWPSLLLLLALATVLAHVDGATGGNVAAPAPAVDCSDALISLVGCLSYVQEGSTVATPEKTCCSGLKDVVKKEVACLCQAFQGGQDYGVALNMTKALQLPAACKVKTPPFSNTCTVFRGTLLRGIAVVFDGTLSNITGRNWKRLHRSSSVPISFRCIHLPRFGKRPPSRSNCCCDSARVSWARL